MSLDAIFTVLIGAFLTLLSGLGLYNPIRVLNRGAPQGTNTVGGENISTMAANIMSRIIKDFTPDGRQVDYHALRQSALYRHDVQAGLYAALRTAAPAALSDTQRRALFINLYNILTVDAILSMKKLPSSTLSVPLFWRSSSYRVGPHTLHLDDMEHGVLRGNKPHLDGTVFFQGNSKAALTVPLDPRIHAALNCGAMSCPKLRSYTAEVLDQQLSEAMTAFCTEGVVVQEDGSLRINQIFSWFGTDFAPTEAEVLRWLSSCTLDSSSRAALLRAADGQLSHDFHYDWTLNDVNR